MEACNAWAKSHGVDAHKHGVEFRASPLGGLGAFATKAINAGDTLLLLPRGFAVTPYVCEVALQDASLARSPRAALALFLCHERARGAASPWAVWLATLPAEGLDGSAFGTSADVLAAAAATRRAENPGAAPADVSPALARQGCSPTQDSEACQQEVSSLISSMQHDVAEARQRQRRELEAAAEPYIRAVHSAQLSMSSQLEALNERQSVEERRVRTLESQALRTSQKLAHMTIAAGARDRSIAIDSRMRNGGLFLTLRVNRPVGHIAQMMGIKPKLEVSSHVIRLSRDGEALHLHTLQEPPSHRDAASEHVRMPIGRLPLGSFVSVSLGAPTWASRAAAFDLPELHAASAARLAAVRRLRLDLSGPQLCSSSTRLGARRPQSPI